MIGKGLFRQETGAAHQRYRITGAAKRMRWKIDQLQSAITVPTRRHLDKVQALQQLLADRDATYKAVEKHNLLKRKLLGLSGSRRLSGDIRKRIPATIQYYTDCNRKILAELHAQIKAASREVRVALEAFLRLQAEEKAQSHKLGRKRIDDLLDQLASSERVQDNSRLVNSLARLIEELEFSDDLRIGDKGFLLAVIYAYTLP
ncbi:MAG: hypothetical protein WC516_01170 [Patescibacteria group bacterium]